MLNKTMSLFIGCLLLMIPLSMAEDGTRETADSIIKNVEAKQNFTTSKSQMSMIVYPDKDDEKTGRKMEMLSYQKGDEYSYMAVLNPKSIKGLCILSRNQDQWIYFPSTGRVRKIASKSKSESMGGIGGDFSNEDMEAGKWQEKYSFAIAAEQNDSWVIQALPLPEKQSSYVKLVITVRKKDYQILRIDYYKQKEGLCKNLTMDEISRISGRDVPTKMTMTNHVKNSKTVVLMTKTEYDLPIDEKYFNPGQFYK